MAPDIPRYVIGDPVRLRQVILNLTGNSIKFTGEGGVTIHVKPDPQNTTGALQDKKGVHRIRIAIEDTGVGISKEAQKSLFNPFSQADSSVARKFGGTGLGLAISQKLIEAMGGHIEINSTEGHGSTFFFTLVMEQGSAEAVEKAETAGSTSQAPVKVMKILIVEDNEINQKLMKELVDRMGHETGTAGSGEEALKILESRDFDMILMDIQLPGMTGMGTTKAIRAMGDRTKAAVPVIALTGNVRDEDVRQCYAANMNGHLAKPVDPKKLKDMIAKVIAGALDNPVELPEEQKEQSAGVRRLDIGDDKFGSVRTASPPPAPPPVRVSEAKGDDFDDEPDERDSRYEVAPITAHARSAVARPVTLELAEEKGAQAAANGTASADIFSRPVLEGLRKNVGDEQLNELLEGMFTEAEGLVHKMDQASAENDLAALAARTHELKGMAGNFGLLEVSNLAARLEDAAKDSQADELKVLMSDMPATLQRAQDALHQWLQS